LARSAADHALTKTNCSAENGYRLFDPPRKIILGVGLPASLFLKPR
jgi:hypothetical protein